SNLLLWIGSGDPHAGSGPIRRPHHLFSFSEKIFFPKYSDGARHRERSDEIAQFRRPTCDRPPGHS
ncbi:MAG: hypothetical protein WAV18_19830, partial [Roseiarcus sp.]